MVDVSRVCVVSATVRELAPSAGWQTFACGVGPVEAALASTAFLARERPAAILQIGIAGARRAAALAPAAVVIGSAARYTDLAVDNAMAPRVVVPSPLLVAAARQVLPDAVAWPIATAGKVGGSTECEVEAMEGFAVLRAAELAGVPALEVRVISNEIEERDRTRWHFEHAFAAVHAITPRLVDAIAQCVN